LYFLSRILFNFCQPNSEGGTLELGARAKIRQKKLAGKLKRIRESLGLTQNEILELFTVEGLNQSNVSAYELGRIEPPLAVIERYAKIANVCMDVLISDEYSLPDQLPSKKLYHPH
jgi:transcriptional regulator with XRE-family HTH domain